jgi:hypothetical protein
LLIIACLENRQEGYQNQNWDPASHHSFIFARLNPVCDHTRFGPLCESTLLNTTSLLVVVYQRNYSEVR